MTSTEESEYARKLFAQPCEFMLAAADPVQFPETGMKEVAFIGRSNVGKSSLVNAVTGRKALARASNTPGRTQQVVFFNLADRLTIVDLPGYGHAVAPRDEQDRWNELVAAYLRHRRPLECVCLLVDGRHGTKSNDLEMMTFLDRAAVKYQVVLTKMDQVKDKDREKNIAQVSALLPQHVAANGALLTTSSEDKAGIDELRVFLAGYALKA